MARRQPDGERLLSAIDLRWVLVNLIAETAHHAGHADATREMLAGHRSAGSPGGRVISSRRTPLARHAA